MYADWTWFYGQCVLEEPQTQHTQQGTSGCMALDDRLKLFFGNVSSFEKHEDRRDIYFRRGEKWLVAEKTKVSFKSKKPMQALKQKKK